MSDIHAPVNEEVEVIIKLKVNFKNVSHYDQLSNSDVRERIELAKSNIKDTLLNMVVDEYCLQPLVDGAKFDYEVINAEQ